MLFNTIILIIAVTANILISLFAYTRNPRSATHRLFAILTFVIATWSITNYISVLAHANPTATWLVRFVIFFSVPLATLFLVLMHTFPRSTITISRKKLFIIASLTLITMGATLTPLIFPTVTLMSGKAPQPQPGIGMVLYAPVVIFSILYGIFILVKKYFKSKGLQRIQHGYLLLGVTVMFTLIISLNFVAVTVFNTTLFIPFGALFTLPFTALTAYAIVRHRMMDIRAAVARSLSFSALVGAFTLIYGAILILAVPYLAKLTSISSEILAAAGALLAVLLARYTQIALRKLTDRFLFQQQADYKKGLVAVSKELSGTININDVTRTILKTMREIVRSKKTVILLQESSGGNFSPRATDKVRNFNISIPPDHVLIQHLKHATGPLIKDELILQKEQAKSSSQASNLGEVEKTFNWLDVAAILPLFVNKKLTGFIALGDKKSGTPYLQDDISFLGALAPQAATALENARLYQESLEFGEKLKAEVKRATHELEIANNQLRDLDKAKSEFLSVASHQLYTPLTALRGYLSMIKEGEYGKTSTRQKYKGWR